MRRWVSTMALAGAVGLMASATAAAADAPKGTTIVLVHGAFAKSASWNGVITDLVAHGYPVIAAANPLRSVKGDAAYVAGIVKSIGGPVVLVGHSYGGTVISLAADGNDNVKALVFVSGLGADAGETAIDHGQDILPGAHSPKPWHRPYLRPTAARTSIFGKADIPPSSPPMCRCAKRSRWRRPNVRSPKPR